MSDAVNDEIVVALDWREIDASRIQGRLAARFHGRWTWFFIGFAALFVALFCQGVLERVIGNGASGFLAACLGALVFIAMAQRQNKRLIRAMSAAPARQEASQISVGPDGIAAPGALAAGRIPWRWVTDVVEDEVGLLVLFSPLEFIPLVDASLPDGMARGTLKARIDAWREAA